MNGHRSQRAFQYMGYCYDSRFHNHRVIAQTPNESFTVGRQWHKNGELYYPINVNLKDNRVFGADDWNHLAQVINFESNYLVTIGQNEKINFAFGIAFSDNELPITKQ